MRNVLKGIELKIFYEYFLKVVASSEEIHFDDLAWIENENRALIAAILGYEGHEDRGTIFRSRSFRPPSEIRQTIKYS